MYSCVSFDWRVIEFRENERLMGLLKRNEDVAIEKHKSPMDKIVKMVIWAVLD